MLIDVLCGALAFAICAGALLLQNASEVAMEFALVLVPVIVFPLATLWRRSFVAVNVWAVAAYVALCWLAQGRIAAVLLPLAITLLVSAAALHRRLAIPAIVLGVAAAALAVPTTWSAMLTRPVHFAAPDVLFTSLDGAPIRLRDLRGQVVVLNFWGVWCGPCVRELPDLAAFAQSADARGARVLAVNSGIGGEDPPQIKRFLATRGIAVPVAIDPGRGAYRAFGIHGLPTTIVIDRNGDAIAQRVGFAATADYRGWLAREVRDALRH